MKLEPSYTKPKSELREIVGEVIQLLKEANETVAVAESLTAGGVMAALGSVAGASSVFRGGVVAYATEVKKNVLKVDTKLIEDKGVFDPDVAWQMAAGARAVTAIEDKATTWGIGTTGVAGPGPSDDHKPQGTVYIGISLAAEKRVPPETMDQAWAWGSFDFQGDRDTIRGDTVIVALVKLRELLQQRKSARLAKH
ncbi:competence-damaged protein domain-containing protein [Hirsutella rhossiliensis]